MLIENKSIEQFYFLASQRTSLLLRNYLFHLGFKFNNTLTVLSSSPSICDSSGGLRHCSTARWCLILSHIVANLAPCSASEPYFIVSFSNFVRAGFPNKD